ncbi:manganese efflux pump MntP [Thermopirellula anaerolimosa]
MSILETLGIAVALSLDALAVSIAAGMQIAGLTGRHVFRIAFHFGLFQFLMPLVGWAIGSQLAVYFASADHWLAFGLLLALGLKMIREAFRRDGASAAKDPTRGWSLVVLSVATSLDALAIGLTLALLEVAVLGPALTIGLVAGTLSMIGIRFGAYLRGQWSRWAEVAGGLVLIGIGCRILIEHL